MKTLKFTLIAITLVFGLNTLYAQSLAPPKEPVKLENLGLVSELIYIKLSAENHAAFFLNNKLAKPDKDELVNKYARVKTAYDQVILQLIADSRAMNSIKYFKQIDEAIYTADISSLDPKYFKNKTGSYLVNLKLANASFQKLIDFSPAILPSAEPAPKQQEKGILPLSSDELLGIGSFINDALKDIREAKVKKVDGIIAILNELRLSPVRELVNPKEKEPDKQKELALLPGSFSDR